MYLRLGFYEQITIKQEYIYEKNILLALGVVGILFGTPLSDAQGEEGFTTLTTAIGIEDKGIQG